MNTTRFVHDPRGIFAQEDSTGAWQWMLGDGLGSVRGVVDDTFTPDESRHYAPYGTVWGTQGSEQTAFGFTGEWTDANELVYLRARYYVPGLGVFPSLDPLEGDVMRAMSLNRYGWVEGNVINLTDPSGMIGEKPGGVDPCLFVPPPPDPGCDLCPEGWHHVPLNYCRVDMLDLVQSATATFFASIPQSRGF